MSTDAAGSTVIATKTTTAMPVTATSNSWADNGDSSDATASAVTIASNIANNIAATAKTLISSSSATTTTTTARTTTTPYASAAMPTTTAKMNVADLSSSLQHFGMVDYLVFVLMLVVCAVIGFYFGFIEKKKKKRSEERRGSEALDYLVGGRKMKVFPVSLSLVASFVSGISLLGTSTEIYVYGTQYAFILITLAFSGVISWYIFLPVFCNLQLTSTYEYFELRFNKSIRVLGSALFTLGTLVWLPIVIYVPALAFNQVTGVNIHIVTPVVCIVCIFYTTVGGLKAVVWTDVIQTIIMVGAILLVVVKGTMDVGGIGVVWQRNRDSGRLEYPTMTIDHTERFSIFAIVVGSVFHYAQVNGGNQVIVQRYLSLPGLREVKQALIIFIAGVVGLTLICIYNGLLLVATYYDCDPLSTKLAKAKDQLVPLLVMDLLSVFPGVPGMFVAGVFSAALSSLSTGLNSLAAVFLEDYIKPLRSEPLTEHQTAVAMRLTTVLIGTFCVLMVFVVERMGTHVMQLSMTLSSISMGPLLGLFIGGLLMPRVNSKSAFAGCVASFVVMSWICLNGQMAQNSGEIAYPEKPVSTAGCTYQFEPVTPTNSTAIDPVDRTLAQQIYHMTFAIYTLVGSIVFMVVAYASSFIYGANDVNSTNIELFAPCIRPWLRAKREYTSVQADEQTVIMDLAMDDQKIIKA